MKLKSKYQRLSPEERLYQLKIPVIGLTGGIATGKTTVSQMLHQSGLPIINADHLVKDVYSLQETKDFISREFPEAIRSGEIQFPKLRELVFSNKEIKSKVENFIYQRLPKAFMEAFSRLRNPEVVVYDVPLLFEKGMQDLFDLNVVVYAPRSIQRARLMGRDGHQEDMANNILKQQFDIEDKKLKADFVIDNSQSEAELAEEVKQFLRQTFDT